MLDKNSEINNTQDATKDNYSLIITGVAVILLLAIASTIYAFKFAQDSYQRDVNNWAIRLGIVADSRAESVSKWVNTQINELTSIAENISLRLYLTELNFNRLDEGRLSNDSAETEYIHNYISVVAEKSGFLPPASIGKKIGVNIKTNNTSGIAIIDKNGNIVVSTETMSKLSDDLKYFINNSSQIQSSLKDMYLDADGRVKMAYLVPIFAVQGENIASQNMGFVFGIKNIDNSLFDLLKQPRSLEKTSETLIVRKSDNIIEYLSPLSDGTSPLKLKIDATRENFAENEAIKNIGSFIDANDYLSQGVLATARSIPHTKWSLIHKISKEEALLESEIRRNNTVAIGLLAISALLIIIFAVWKHGASIRYKKMATKFRSQERLLRLVADNQPDSLFIIDHDGRFRFANRKTALNSGLELSDIIGKKTQNIFGNEKAEEYNEINKKVTANDLKISHVRKVKDGDSEKVIQSRYIPLKRVPRVLTTGETSGVLVVEQDITQAMSEREKREQNLKSLVDAMVKMVDKRDHFSADHSIKTAKIAKAIAREMKLDEIAVETVEYAGKLMNLGKMMLPIKLLAKKGKLSDDERTEISEAIASSAEFLKDIQFNGNVMETIKYCQERIDGKGFFNLTESEIPLTAQIVSLANAYVAVTSPRAYREELNTDEAIKIFMNEVNEKYNRKVVIALVNHLDNSSKQ